tara:strand:+ start:960 stop:1316 length:357 start_codon:yes stop_codon:yes gene_type:complete
MNKHARDDSRDSGGSNNPKGERSKVNLVITGGTKFRSIEHTDEADELAAAKRRGRAFVVSSGKKASLNAGSPTDNKKANVRVIGVSDTLRKAMNLKNRRLRSQENNDGIQDKPKVSFG